ncbi:MAG: twin-arginine translocation signal domain-containing protein, partial [Pseudomonadota bacterium]
MKDSVLTRRGFLIGATAGGAALMASSYLKRDSWAAQESAQKSSGDKIKDSESESHGADSSTFHVVDTYLFP